MKNYEHEFYVTQKCTTYKYYTVNAESMEEAKEKIEQWDDMELQDWEEFDYETVEIEEQEIPEQQLTLSGVFYWHIVTFVATMMMNILMASPL